MVFSLKSGAEWVKRGGGVGRFGLDFEFSAALAHIHHAASKQNTLQKTGKKCSGEWAG